MYVNTLQEPVLFQGFIPKKTNTPPCAHNPP